MKRRAGPGAGRGARSWPGEILCKLVPSALQLRAKRSGASGAIWSWSRAGHWEKLDLRISRTSTLRLICCRWGSQSAIS